MSGRDVTTNNPAECGCSSCSLQAQNRNDERPKVLWEHLD